MNCFIVKQQQMICDLQNNISYLNNFCVFLQDCYEILCSATPSNIIKHSNMQGHLFKQIIQQFISALKCTNNPSFVIIKPFIRQYIEQQLQNRNQDKKLCTPHIIGLCTASIKEKFGSTFQYEGVKYNRHNKQNLFGLQLPQQLETMYQKFKIDFNEEKIRKQKQRRLLQLQKVQFKKSNLTKVKSENNSTKDNQLQQINQSEDQQQDNQELSSQKIVNTSKLSKKMGKVSKINKIEQYFTKNNNKKIKETFLNQTKVLNLGLKHKSLIFHKNESIENRQRYLLNKVSQLQDQIKEMEVVNRYLIKVISKHEQQENNQSFFKNYQFESTIIINIYPLVIAILIIFVNKLSLVQC